MNHVIIIDDEIQSRNGIAEIFRNHSPQWEIGGVFEDGSQALEYLLQHPEINLIVTDIRMPKFDGLELISRIRQYNKLIPIIIISGYSEFSYAKKAVDYQVFRYIVKPILPSEFDAVITSVENFFRLEDDPFNEYNLTSSEFDQFLDLLFSESVSLNKSQTIHILEKQCGFSFQGAWFLLIAGNHEFNNHIDNHRALIQNFASEISPEHHVFLFHEKIYCIILQKTDIDYDAFKRHMQKFIWKFSSDLFVHTGIYHSCNNDTLKNAFFSALSTLTQFFYSKTSVHIYQDQKLCDFPYSVYKNLQLQLTNGNLLNIRDEIYSFMDYIRVKQPSYYELHSWINKITHIIIQYCNDKKVPSSYYIDYTENLQFLYNFYCLEDIENTLLAMIDNIFEKIAEQTNSTNTFLVEQIQNYLSDHISENLTLSDLGDVFGISYSSLSNIFSSTTGQTIIEYLTFIRMQRAKELLINTNKKIYEICSDIGYSEPKYFIKRFHQIVGVTPKEYRKIYTK